MGSTRIGVAISDELGATAGPLAVVETTAKKGGPVEKIGQLLAPYTIELAVVGLPLSMSGGDRGTSSRRAQAFGKAIEKKLGIKVAYFDERFSTKEANRVLIEGKVRRKDRKQVVDKVAATVILQGFLDSQKSQLR